MSTPEKELAEGLLGSQDGSDNQLLHLEMYLVRKALEPDVGFSDAVEKFFRPASYQDVIKLVEAAIENATFLPQEKENMMALNDEELKTELEKKFPGTLTKIDSHANILKQNLQRESIFNAVSKGLESLFPSFHALDENSELAHDATPLGEAFPPVVGQILQATIDIIKALESAAGFLAKRYNPMRSSEESKSSSPEKIARRVSKTFRMIGLVSLVGLGVGVASPVLLGVVVAGTLALGIANVVSLGSELKKFGDELKKKDVGAKGLRLFRQGLNCVTRASNSSLYICLSILAVGALLSNPVGLSVVAAVVVTIAAVSLGVSLFNLGMKYLATRQIKKQEAEFAARQKGIEMTLNPSPAVEPSVKPTLSHKLGELAVQQEALKTVHEGSQKEHLPHFQSAIAHSSAPLAQPLSEPSNSKSPQLESPQASSSIKPGK